MAKITFEGMEDYMKALEKMGADAENIAKKALYNGAKVAADEIRLSLSSIPTDEEWGTGKHKAKGIKEGQKQALLKGLGIAEFQENGGKIDTRIGFSGYSDYKTERFPNGQPLALIARVAESGTSFTEKTPFMAKAIRKARKRSEEKMRETFESEIEKIMKE